MNDFEVQKKLLLQPLLFEAGAALMDCQGFEFGVGLLLLQLSRLGLTNIDPARVGLILDDKEKKTAGQLIAMLKKHVTVSDGIERALEHALAARNRLIHRVLIDNIEQVAKQETRLALNKEVRSLRSQVQHADGLLRPFVIALNEALDGVNHQQLEDELKSMLS